MQLGVTIEGNFKEMMVAEVLDTEKAVTSAIRRASNGIKGEVRRQVKSAGLGERFANTIRSNVYPERRDSLNTAGFIFGAAKSSNDRFYTNVFEEGKTIRASGAKWLAFPINKGYVGNRRVTIADMKNVKMAFVPTEKPGVALLVQRTKGRPDTPLFILVKQVRIRKSIDALATSSTWADKVPELIMAEMEKVSR